MERKILQNAHYIKIGVILTLVLLLTCPFVAISRAVGSFGYKEGDSYSFTVTTSSSSSTDEGTASSTTSSLFNYKIRNIDTNSGGYRIKVDYWMVTATGLGMSVSGPILSEGTMEGDPEPFIAYSSYGSYPSVFVTADWNTRGDEWNDYVNQVRSISGWMLKDYTGTHGETNGVFTLNVQYDVSDANSHIDYNDDGSRDGYTGTMSTSILYDANGVLSSCSIQSSMVFTSKNSATFSTSITRGGAALLPSDTAVLVVVGVVAFIIALALGYFIGRGRRPLEAAYARSPSGQSPPPP